MRIKGQKRRKMKYLFIFGTVFIIVILYFFDFGFLSGKITAYPLSCDRENYINYRCKEKWLPLNPTTYKPSAKRQEIIYSTLGSWETLTKCSVSDRKSWTCKYNDESAEFGFDKGQFWEVSLGENIYSVKSASDNLFEIRYVPKYLYRLEELKWQ